MREYIHHKIFFITAVLTVICLPFSIQLCSGSIILLTLNWLVEGDFVNKWQKFKSNPFIWLFISLFIIYAVGLLHSEFVSNGLFSLEKKLSLLVFPLVFGTSRQFRKKEVNLIAYAFIGACLIAIILSLYFSFSHSQNSDPLLVNFDAFSAAKFSKMFENKSTYWNALSYVGFGADLHLHPTYFSLYLVFSIVLITYTTYKNFAAYKMGKKLFVLSIILIMLFSITLLSSKAVIIAFSMMAEFFLAYFFIERQKYFKGAFFCFAFVIVLFALVYINPVSRFRMVEEPMHTPLSYAKTSQEWNSINLRLVEWRSSLAVISQNPLFGVGTGDTKNELSKKYEAVNLGEFNKDFNSHNQFLQTGIALGLLGFICLSFSFLWPTWEAYKQKNILYIIFIFLFGMCCLTESMLEVQKGVVFYGFFNSLLAFQVFNLNPNHND